MRRILLGAALLLAATPAAAQKQRPDTMTTSPGPEGQEAASAAAPTISVKLPGTTFSAYRRALAALRHQDFQILAALLEDGKLLTLPRYDSAQAVPGKRFGPQVMAVVTPAGADSAKIELAARVVAEPEGRPLSAQERQAGTVLPLTVMFAIMHDVTHPPAGTPEWAGPDPRRAPDTGAYGFARSNPVKVGGGQSAGWANERGYMDALAGPNGEKVEYERLGSCCEFPNPALPNGGGVLDVYEVRYPGIPAPVLIYLDLYETEPARRAPAGFRLR